MNLRYTIIMLSTCLSMACCSCAHVKNDGADVRTAHASTVLVDQHVSGRKIVQDPDGGIEFIDGGSGGSIGSGVVVGVIGGESIVATAGHVAHRKEIMVDTDTSPPEVTLIDSSVLKIRTLDGTVCDAREVFYDEEEDISILRVACIAGTPMPLAAGEPPMGADVIVLGAAMTIHPDGIFIPSDGRWVGDLSGQNLGTAITAPVAGGHSGAPVVHDGRLVGMIKSHRLDYEHLSFIVPLDVIRNGLETVRKNWNAK